MNRAQLLSFFCVVWALSLGSARAAELPEFHVRGGLAGPRRRQDRPRRGGARRLSRRQHHRRQRLATRQTSATWRRAYPAARFTEVFAAVSGTGSD